MTVGRVIKFPDGSVWYYRMDEDGGALKWLDRDIAGYADEFKNPEPLDDSNFPQITFEQMLASTTPQERSKP